jgi:aminotransferase EvaB
MPVVNFLPAQYDATDAKPINHNYLTEQFADYPAIFEKLAEVVRRGDFTLGRAVDEFEQAFAKAAGSKYAIGVGSGTDALFLSLKALDIGPGDEVITTPFTFYATIGSIVTSGARPVFVDVGEDFNIDPSKIEAAITPRTRAIMPVHWSGKPCRMDLIGEIARRRGLAIVEDACHAITATYKGQSAGSFGISGCFSMHPLKNLNVWGDGGVVCTQSEEFAAKMRLLRNHGLENRDTCRIFAYNSRLDTIQAVVGHHLLNKIDDISDKRIAHAQYLDNGLQGIAGVTIPPRHADHVRHVYHIYSLRFERREALQKFLEGRGIDAKVHYPVPMHMQPAAAPYGYKRGDFPMAEAIANSTLSLPVHEFITREQMDQMIEAIREFYA